MPTIITNDPSIIEFIEELFKNENNLDFSDEAYDSWYCIQLKPFKCGNCGMLICYAQVGPHLILIFPEKDDENLLEIAKFLNHDKEDDYDPYVVRYNHSFGPCISFEKAAEMGLIGKLE